MKVTIGDFLKRPRLLIGFRKQEKNEIKNEERWSRSAQKEKIRRRGKGNSEGLPGGGE